MPVQNATFGTFADGGDLQFDDVVVGLRDGVNTRFSYQGAPGVYLPLAGGTMEGAIDMDTNSITGLPLPTLSTDASSKAYVDSLTAPVGAAGTFQRSNGTAWLASTATIPDTYVLGDIIYASAANVLTALTGNITTAKQYLSMTGTGAAAQAPSWATISGGDITGAALSKTDDTNVTLTLGGTPLTALLRAASLTLGWTGTLAVGRGGSGASTLTGLLTGNGTSAFTATAITQYNVLTGGVSNVPNSVAPSATTGVPLISQGAASQPVFGTALVVGGGTGNTTFTAYSVLCAGTTATGAFQNVSGVGTANQVLVSNGAAALPTWQDVPGLVPAALTRTDDTNVTITLGGTPTTSLLQAVSLTMGWSGQLSLARGGSNANLTAVNGGIVYSTATAMAISAAGTSGQLLQSAGAAAPVWTTAAYPATAGTSGNFMQSNGTNWLSASPAALTKTDDTNVTLTLGGTPTTALMAATSLTLGWTGQLGVARGGTGLAAITAHNLIIGNGTSAATLLAPSATSGVPLISQGASADPVYGTALVAGGGTGLTSATAYAVLCGGTTSTGAFQSVASVGSTGQVLTSNGAGALPTFQNVAGTGTVNSGTANQLTYYAGTGTAVSGLATTASSYLISSAGGVPTWAAYGQLPGTTTNDNASTGNVGEFVSSTVLVGSAVGCTTGSTANLTSISLGAGDWDVEATIYTTLGSGTVTSSLNIGVSTTSATLSQGINGTLVGWNNAPSNANSSWGLCCGASRISLSGTTTVYAVFNSVFSVSTLGIYGWITARRVR